MTKIVQLKRHEPIPEVIEMLEDMLAKARTGKIVGIAAIPIYEDKIPGTGIAGYVYRLEVIGALFSLMREIEHDIEYEEQT